MGINFMHYALKLLYVTIEVRRLYIGPFKFSTIIF